MTKVFHVAWREFVATVATKGFIIGVLVTPVMLGIMALVLPRMLHDKPPKIDGELAVVDPTGEVIDEVRAYLQPERIAERRGELKQRIEEATPEGLRTMSRKAGGGIGEQALDAMLGELPEIDVLPIAPQALDLEAEKARLLEGSTQEGGRLALALIEPDSVRRASEAEAYGAYELYVREKLDDRIEDEIKGALRHAIVEARIRAAGLDSASIQALTDFKRVRSRTVTDKGERETNEFLNAMLPAAFMGLLLISVLSSGQALMTTTIEEKSSRVVEVLLSAVSPMQLMAGKIIGQMCAGFLILALYSGMGIAALVSFALLGLVDLTLLVYLVIFYLIAFFIIGSLMAAIGAAVNEMREAQTLMTPVMLLLMIPWLLWIGIARDPNSLFATVLSFTPPVNTFVIMLRMTSSTPPPDWQVWLSIAIGVASMWAAVWFAAKVFRVGLLMFGKPPNFRTLVRWVRMA